MNFSENQVSVEIHAIWLRPRSIAQAAAGSPC
jgi:hypothetical protein